MVTVFPALSILHHYKEIALGQLVFGWCFSLINRMDNWKLIVQWKQDPTDKNNEQENVTQFEYYYRLCDQKQISFRV